MWRWWCCSNGVVGVALRQFHCGDGVVHLVAWLLWWWGGVDVVKMVVMW